VPSLAYRQPKKMSLRTRSFTDQLRSGIPEQNIRYMGSPSRTEEITVRREQPGPVAEAAASLRDVFSPTVRRVLVVVGVVALALLVWNFIRKRMVLLQIVEAKKGRKSRDEDYDVDLVERPCRSVLHPGKVYDNLSLGCLRAHLVERSASDANHGRSIPPILLLVTKRGCVHCDRALPHFEEACRQNADANVLFIVIEAQQISALQKYAHHTQSFQRSTVLQALRDNVQHYPTLILVEEGTQAVMEGNCLRPQVAVMTCPLDKNVFSAAASHVQHMDKQQSSASLSANMSLSFNAEQQDEV
jgi:thiol-disulfide isomerase/thioredoxin